MKNRLILIAGLLLAGCHHGSGSGSSSGAGSTSATANIQGFWQGGVTISPPPNLMTFVLSESTTSVATINNITGLWSLPTQAGSLTGTVTNDTFAFTLTESPGCPGTFTGTGDVTVTSSMTITFSGSDCHGTASGVTGTLIRK